MLKRLIFAVSLLLGAPQSHAFEGTDVFYIPSESGWGMFLVQSATTQFVALFIYGTDNKPTWYTATLKQDASGNYAGQLIATTGSYFGAPWSPAQLTVNTVGTIAIQPLSPYHGTVTYSLNGGPTVTKTVQRQPLTDHVLAGGYTGGFSGSQLTCADPNDNDANIHGTFDLSVTQSTSAATLTLTLTDGKYKGTVCTLGGPLTLLGRLYRMATTQLACVGPDGSSSDPVSVEGLHPTDWGIEFRVVETGGCNLKLNFVAVRNN